MIQYSYKKQNLNKKECIMLEKDYNSKPITEESNAAQVHEAFYNKVRNAYRSDSLYEMPDDEDLTPEEIEAIRKFWGKYSFAYPDIDFTSFKSFKNRRGKVEVMHMPGVVRTQYLKPKFLNNEFKIALQSKGLLPLLFANAKQPKTVLRQMDGHYADTRNSRRSVRQGRFPARRRACAAPYPGRSRNFLFEHRRKHSKNQRHNQTSRRRRLCNSGSA